ncbi:methyl-accepting chemotaxis protein [Marinobacterium zhoushanense]|uniref:Methyl-accepting chemotaxis protein n=1 Tax=Marinobacterium zhoushanense TaxID=1679163 RepID=A0ABQ1K145_9GAMM|nr:methyl-accepting chemotaxis protein [Marinobacterium zhoushanense]GGB81882.1 methyl-accepting chemotaxis protein [Marinobacterium zhoushanense]
MTLPKLGFKQSLLLVVLLTTFGFSFLVYMSISTLIHQTDAAKKVDILGSWVISVSNIKADVSIASRLTPEEGPEKLDQLYNNKFQELESLRELGMRDAVTLEADLEDWTNTYKQQLTLKKQIGTGNNDGQRALVTQALNELKNNSFSFMDEDLRTLSDVVYQLIEHRSMKSMDTYEQVKSHIEKSLETRGFLKAFEQYLSKLDQEMLQLSGLISQYLLLDVKNNSKLAALNNDVDKILDNVLKELSSARKRAEETSNSARTTILIAGILVTSFCMLLLLITWRRSTRSLSATLICLEQIASGDLSLRMPVSNGTQDEFDRLGSAVNHLTVALGSILNSVKGSSGQLLHMSSELNDTMKLQVHESEQIESETSTVAASIEEISHTVAGMAQASEETNKLSVKALTATENGGLVITYALGLLEQLSNLFEHIHGQLNDLNSASTRVDNVTGIINGLAEQTNLLALNAAIEAARAGEAGRGFSVVADEVRALAEKTVVATTNINTIILDMKQQMQKILGSMEDGRSQVSASRDSGDKAISEMNQISQLFSQVSDRNQQQAVSIEEISSTAHAIAESMNTVLKNVSKSSDRSREIGSFSTDVLEHADKLLELTNEFRC